MFPADAVSALTVVFIVGMVWLRTRMHYPRDRERRVLTRAGRIYFVALLVVLACGWFLAPPLGQAIRPGPMTTPLLARVVWFLATYYLYIPVHHFLRSRGARMFTAAVRD
jgi:hypothetical protein